MGKGKQVIVSWDDLDDDDLFDDDPIEPSQGQCAPAADDATLAAATAATPAHIFRSTEPSVMTPMDELHLGTLDLRNEINQLSTSNNNVNIHGRPEPISGTNPGVDHHTDGDWKSESSWRNDRKGVLKSTLPAKEDLRDAITTMTRQMKDLESPGTRTTGSGISLVAIRNNLDPKPTSSSGRPSASDVIAAPLKRDSYRPRSRSRSRSRGGESSRRRKSRSQSKERSSWSWSRGKARSRSRDRSRERDTTSRRRSRSRGRSRSRDRRRRRSRERSRSRDRRRSSRERSRSRDGHRSRGRSRSRDRGRERGNNQDREKDKERDRGRRRSRSRSTSIGKHRSRGRSRSSSIPRIKEEDKPSSWANSASIKSNSITSSASPSVHGTTQRSVITATDTIPTSSPSLSISLSNLRSPANYPAALSSSSSSSIPSMVDSPITLSHTAALINTEALIGSMDLTRTTMPNTTTTSSTASSPVIDPPPTTDPNLASELKDPVATTKIKLEPEDAPSLPQVAKASSPEVVVKQEPLCSDDATKILREASQPVSAITRTTTTTSEQGFPGQIEAEVRAQDQDPHYFVIRVSDEVDFNDARKNNVWPTNPMYDKALRRLYSPTSQVFLIFTVFMSSEFCGIAKMASEMMWVGERTIFDKSALRQKFKLQWVACSRVSYDTVKELTHEPVYKIIRKNGHELTQDMGGAIHKLLVENQPEEEPQPALASQEADNSVLDISTTSFSQEMLMGKSIDDQESSTLLLDSIFRDASDMDVDVSKLATISSDDNHKDDDEYEVDYGDDSSSMDLDSNPNADVALIELPSPKATPRHNPYARKRSISADENVDLSMELELAHEEREQLARGRSLEPSYVERVDEKTDGKEDQETEEKEEELGEEDEEMELGADLIHQDAPPVSTQSPMKHRSPPHLSPPPHSSTPSKRWSPSRRRSPPPPRPRSSPPPCKRSPSRNRSPPPPRRNRSPPPPRRRSPPPLRRRSPPPHYHQPSSYGRPGYAAASTPYYGFWSPPPFPQRSKDPRDRSASTYVFHSGNEPNYQRDRFHNAPTDPRLSGSRSASSSVVPQKRLYDETSGSLEDDKSGILGEGEFKDLPASVFPLADDDDDGMGGQFAPLPQAGNPSAAAGASSSAAVGVSSSSAMPGGPSSSTSTVPPADPQSQITSITLVPAGLSKSRRKKMRKEAFSKPLDF